MSLPEPLLELAADVVPDAESNGRLAFAYAHGALLCGFGTNDELGLTCVWDHQDIPDRAPVRAAHMTQTQFDTMMKSVTTGDGWADPSRLPLADVAGFAYGVLLSDEDGAGTAARGTVGEFPYALADHSVASLAKARGFTADELVRRPDPWARADLLSKSVYRAYVAWFAIHERYFPGARRRAEYAEYFGMDPQIPLLELQIWQATKPAEARSCYLEFVNRILSEA